MPRRDSRAIAVDDVHPVITVALEQHLDALGIDAWGAAADAFAVAYLSTPVDDEPHAGVVAAGLDDVVRGRAVGELDPVEAILAQSGADLAWRDQSAPVPLS